MLRIGSSVRLSFSELGKKKKKNDTTKSDEQTNAHLFSHKTRSLQANQTWKGFLASALANMGRSRDALIKPLHSGLHKVRGEKKKKCEKCMPVIATAANFAGTPLQSLWNWRQNIALKMKNGPFDYCTDMNFTRQPFWLPQAITGLFKRYHWGTSRRKLA